MNLGFDRPGRIKRLEVTAVAALALAMVAMMLGQGAERYAAGAAPSQLALSDPNGGETKAGTLGSPIFNTLDYATTGAIKGRSVVVSPCTIQTIER